MPDKPLAGQAALVTGASRGIGAGIARAFAAAGARVALNHQGSTDAAEAVAASIRAGGGAAITVRADVADEAQVRAMVERVVDAFGRFDILVNNAGIQRDAPVHEMTLDDWQRVLAVNLTGQFLCARAAVRAFLAGDAADAAGARSARGKIICISSVHDTIAWAGHANYAASKGGVLMLMKTLAQELAPQRIRVNGIAPGAIRTDINRAAWSTPQAERALLELIPYGRVGDVDDVARAAVWLASDASDYVTGAMLAVDGGMLLYPAFRTGG
jgi:glucose 1-dehydrogenase